MSSGYSVSVKRTPEGTKVYVKVGKDTNVNELRRQLQQQYPGAQMEIEGGIPLIREISIRSVEEEQEESSEKGVQTRGTNYGKSVPTYADGFPCPHDRSKWDVLGGLRQSYPIASFCTMELA